jgi:NDP-sugar pyrophosphorylase family protein
MSQSPLQPIHLLLPMSGQGTRFQKAGYTQPKPLIPVSGKPMIERLLSVFPESWPTTAILAENHFKTELPNVLKAVRPKITLKEIGQHQKGPGFALRSVLDTIPEDAPVLVSYCDYGMSWDPSHFEEFVRSTNCDACLVSYRGFHAHYLSPVPYAYSRMDGERVVEVKEKGWFGNDRELEYASCGAYYFRTAGLLRKALDEQDARELVLNGESYTSLTVQALLAADPKAHVRVFEIPYFYQWGTPEDLEIYEYWSKTLKSYSRFQGTAYSSFATEQVLMPMCGLGSRFTSITPLPKPFIPIDSRPMYREALASLPKGKVGIVALKQHESFLNQSKAKTDNVQYLDATPSGQALSVAAGLPLLKDDGDIIISSCDHGIVLDPAVWKSFKTQSKADAAIFTVQGFPGGKRKPNAYAWVEIENPKTTFSPVRNVSVKKPISDKPEKDHLLVGTFWFKNKKVLQQGLERLIAKDTRVNGEVYLDSIFNELIELGLKVEVIPLDGYINWGDPDSLAESLYWQEVHFGRSYTRRPRFPGVVLNEKV